MFPQRKPTRFSVRKLNRSSRGRFDNGFTGTCIDTGPGRNACQDSTLQLRHLETTATGLTHFPCYVLIEPTRNFAYNLDPWKFKVLERFSRYRTHYERKYGFRGSEKKRCFINFEILSWLFYWHARYAVRTLHSAKIRIQHSPVGSNCINGLLIGLVKIRNSFGVKLFLCACLNVKRLHFAFVPMYLQFKRGKDYCDSYCKGQISFSDYNCTLYYILDHNI